MTISLLSTLTTLFFTTKTDTRNKVSLRTTIPQEHISQQILIVMLGIHQMPVLDTVRQPQARCASHLYLALLSCHNLDFMLYSTDSDLFATIHLWYHVHIDYHDQYNFDLFIFEILLLQKSQFILYDDSLVTRMLLLVIHSVFYVIERELVPILQGEFFWKKTTTTICLLLVHVSPVTEAINIKFMSLELKALRMTSGIFAHGRKQIVMSLNHRTTSH